MGGSTTNESEPHFDREGVASGGTQCRLATSVGRLAECHQRNVWHLQTSAHLPRS